MADVHSAPTRDLDVVTLVDDAVHGPADVRENDGPSRAHEQLLSERLLQLPKLTTDRGLRDMELLARARHTTFANDRPEMIEVVMIEHLHGGKDTSERPYGSRPKEVLDRSPARLHTAGGR